MTTLCLVDTPQAVAAARRDLPDAVLVTDNPLLAADLPNLIITPHSAWVSRESRQRLLDGVLGNIRAWKAGRPSNVVNGIERA